MTEAQERAEQLENQIYDLLTLVKRDDFADVYTGDVDEAQASLKSHLETLRTSIRQLSAVEDEDFFVGDRQLANVERTLIKNIEAIGVELEFEINPKLVATAKQLAEKAERVKAEDQGLLNQAFEALDRAIAMVAAPVTKAAALAMAIKTIMDFFQAVSK